MPAASDGRKIAAECRIDGRDADRGRQAAHRLLGEARPRQHGERPAGQHLLQHFRHQQPARGLDALGADHHRRCRPAAAPPARAPPAPDRPAAARRTTPSSSRSRRRLDAGLERDARQIDRIGALVSRSPLEIAGSRDHSVTCRPARRARQASAVPQAPPPTTPIWADVGHRLRLKAIEMRSALPL